MAPPWLPGFLQTVRTEWQQPLPPIEHDNPTEAEWRYAETQAKQDTFDTLGLKQSTIQSVRQGLAKFTVQRCDLGTLLILGQPLTKKDTEDVWHSVRLLSPNKLVRILLYLHPQTRVPPPKGEPIQAEHINGGVTMPCDARTITVYRREEFLRVLLHELFHASCSDPYKKSVPYVEADCEAWAELCLCALRAKGDIGRFQGLWAKQLKHAANLSAYLQKYHGVKSPSDYAWRYTVGRLDVWMRLGFRIPVGHVPSQLTTLRLTTC